MNSEAKTFRTKTGRREFTRETIRLVRTGFRGWLAQRLHGDRFPSEVSRKHITRVEAHPPVTGITRGYFWIHYQDAGEIKKRIIILPGSLSGGALEYEKAKRIFELEGMMK
jgi:hypothetical protein